MMFLFQACDPEYESPVGAIQAHNFSLGLVLMAVLAYYLRVRKQKLDLAPCKLV
jgi:hypothetical protein